jgi:hypothetical protein
MWTYTWFIHHSLLSLAVCIDALSQVSQLSQISYHMLHAGIVTVSQTPGHKLLRPRG